MEVGGAAVGPEVARQQASHDLHTSELFSFPIIAMLLVAAFGSLVAAALPLAVAVFTAAATTAVLRALTDVTEVSVYALNIGTACAFALAIDYSLFLISRHREERRKGASVEAALRTALATAGRAVAFSAATVACGMSALLVFPHPALRSIGCAGIAVTILAAVGALVMLPALMAVLGEGLERFDPFARVRRKRGARRSLGRREDEAPGPWGRVAATMMRRPLSAGIPLACSVVLLALPFTQARFGLFDERVLPASAPAARVGAALRDDFGHGAMGATAVVLPGLDAHGRAGELDDYARRVSAAPAEFCLAPYEWSGLFASYGARRSGINAR